MCIRDRLHALQADWFVLVDPEGQADPDGGLTDDDEWLGASWDDEAWDYPAAPNNGVGFLVSDRVGLLAVPRMRSVY